MVQGGNPEVAAEPARPWWQRLLAWLRRLQKRVLALPAAPEKREAGRAGRDELRSLSLPVRQRLEALEDVQGAARATVDAAVQDYLHLREVLLGPGASTRALDDVEILASAEAALSYILEHAPRVWTLSNIAAQRERDRAGRQAAGEALLELDDVGKKLHDTASAAIQWASSRADEDCRRLAARARELDDRGALRRR